MSATKATSSRKADKSALSAVFSNSTAFDISSFIFSIRFKASAVFSLSSSSLYPVSDIIFSRSSEILSSSEASLKFDITPAKSVNFFPLLLISGISSAFKSASKKRHPRILGEKRHFFDCRGPYSSFGNVYNSF